MSDAQKTLGKVKERLSHELIEYGLNVLYLTLVFASFIVYRRLLLAAYDISYTNYWIALIEALVLGKVIMIGSVFHLGRGLENKALIYPTLYKTVVFTVFIGAFKAGEHAVKALWAGQDVMQQFASFTEADVKLMLANALMIFVALIPFFAMKELGRVYGRDKVGGLFFHRRQEG